MENWEKTLSARSAEMLLLSLLFVLTATDIILTLFALDNGFVEANPVMLVFMNVSIPFAIAFKYIIIFLPSVMALLYLKRKSDGRKMIVTALILPVIITACVVAWNVTMLLAWLT